MMTIREFFTENQRNGRVNMVSWPDDADSNFLALVQHPDGRLDLVDYGCNDTGSDLSALTIDCLQLQVERWLRCIECDRESRGTAVFALTGRQEVL